MYPGRDCEETIPAAHEYCRYVLAKYVISALTTWYGGADIVIMMCECECVSMWVGEYVGMRVGVYCVICVSTMKRKPLIRTTCKDCV